MANELLTYIKTGNVFEDACSIIDTAQKVAYSAVNLTLVHRNWLLGKRIAEEELNGDSRAEYGAEVIKKLARELNEQYGKGYTKTNLYNFYSFYKLYPEIFHSESGKSKATLSWTHYRVLLQVKDEEARAWYEKEALRETWSVKTLQRNISSQFYHRILQSQIKEPVIEEMHQLTEEFQNDKLEFIKNPMIVEFLGLSEDASFTETALESSIITNLQKFLMELGKGYAFVARQQHIHTEKEGDNPTLGIVLCADTDEDIAKYSILHGNEQLFASKYKLYLPTEEELRAEIETQKEMFKLQQEEKKDEE